jgi:two-component system, OmpR family, response regulator RegX3
VTGNGDARILLVDDDPGVREVVSYALRQEGFDITEAHDGETALELARRGRVDLVILDVMLPALSGVDVCRELRAHSAVPIIMLTAKDSEHDRVIGLELGADDYVTKPFSMNELVSRVRAMLRRRALDRSEVARTKEFGGLRLDLATQTAEVDGREVRLTPSEVRILSLLSDAPGVVVSRADLMRHLWNSDHVGDEHACEVHISNLRRKIERDPSQPQRLVTVRGQGYKLVAV